MSSNLVPGYERRTMIVDGRKLKRTKSPQYYYHITEQKWNPFVTLQPRDRGFKRGSEEPDISRICVGPSITHCLASTVMSRDMKVFRTQHKVFAYHSIGVVDSFYTREKWLLRAIRFIDICDIDNAIIREMGIQKLDGTYGSIKKMRIKIKAIRKILEKYDFPEYP